MTSADFVLSTFSLSFQLMTAKPYFTDEDTEFWTEFYKNYHLKDDSGAEPVVDDETLKKLVQSSPPSPNETDPLKIFQEIKDCTGSEESARQLKRRYNRILSVENGDETTIDYEKSSENLCNRCLRYGCKEHKQINKKVKGEFNHEHEPGVEPCGENCYMNSGNAGSSNLVWSIADTSMFRVAFRIFPKDYCRIAQILTSKTCKETKQFADNLPDDELNLPVVDDQQRASVSKKKEGKPSSRKIWISRSVQKAKKGINEDDLRLSYRPCSCEGRCDKNCRCSDDYCEKFCECPQNCQKRFPGCECKGKCDSNRCPCYIGKRECDPDVCKCKMPSRFEPKPEATCVNCQLQMQQGKHLLMGISTAVEGYGCFTKDDIAKGELVSVSFKDRSRDFSNPIVLLSGILWRADQRGGGKSPRSHL